MNYGFGEGQAQKPVQLSGHTPFDSRVMAVPLHFFPEDNATPVGNYNALSYGVHLKNIQYDFPVALEIKYDSTGQTENDGSIGRNTLMLMPGDSAKWPHGSRNVQMRVVFINPAEDPNPAATAEITCRLIFFSLHDSWAQGNEGFRFPSQLAANQPIATGLTEEASVAGYAALTTLTNVTLSGRWKLRFTFFATVAMRWRVQFGTFRNAIPIDSSMTIGVDGVTNTVVEVGAGTYDGDASHNLTVQNIDEIQIGDGFSYICELLPAGLNE